MGITQSFFDERVARATTVVVSSELQQGRFVEVTTNENEKIPAYFCGPRTHLPRVGPGTTVECVRHRDRAMIISGAESGGARVRKLVLDGRGCQSFEEFCVQVEELFCPGFCIGRSLIAVDDMFGGGLTDTFLYCESIALHWTQSKISEQMLNHDELMFAVAAVPGKACCRKPLRAHTL